MLEVEEEILDVRSPFVDIDTPWKNLLDRYLKAFLYDSLPDLAEDIDWSKEPITLDKEFKKLMRDEAIGHRIADKLIKVWKKSGEELFLLIHFEIQGQKEKDFPERMFIYHYRIKDRYQLPVISIAILIDNNDDWRPNYFKESYYGCSVEMHYHVVKLLDFKHRKAEFEQRDDPFAMIVLIQLAAIEMSKKPLERYQLKVALTRKLYEKQWQKQDIIHLYAFIDWLITLPEKLMLK